MDGTVFVVMKSPVLRDCLFASLLECKGVACMHAWDCLHVNEDAHFGLRRR